MEWKKVEPSKTWKQSSVLQAKFESFVHGKEGIETIYESILTSKSMSSKGTASTALIFKVESGLMTANPPLTTFFQTREQIKIRKKKPTLVRIRGGTVKEKWKGTHTKVFFRLVGFHNDIHDSWSQLSNGRNMICQDTHVTSCGSEIDLNDGSVF